MIDVQAVVQHHLLRANHVIVVVRREVRVQAIGGLRRLAMADIIRQHKIILRDIERLAGTEEHVREHRIQQRAGVAARAMQQQNGVVRLPGCVAMRRAKRQVVKMQRGQRLARAEAEVGDVIGALRRSPVRRPRRRQRVAACCLLRKHGRRQQDRQASKLPHVRLPPSGQCCDPCAWVSGARLPERAAS